MKSLDLFSGIGGLTHALRDLGIEPSMYVEIEPKAQCVLKARMADGHLPQAPLHPDVRTLRSTDVPGPIDIIVAGSPCIGFSSAGLRHGLKNEQSGLFMEVMRLAKDLRPSYLFFENVASIRTVGLKHVLEELRKLDYHCWWIALPAYVVGAPQYRRRWYCLCVKKEAPMVTLTARTPWQSYDWSREPPLVARTTVDPRRKSESYARCGLLGNSVVPDSVRLAFLLLWTGLQKTTPDTILHQPSWTLQLPTPIKTVPKEAHLSVAAMQLLDQDVIRRVATPIHIPPEPSSEANITLDPETFRHKRPKNPSQTATVITQPIVLRAWASPRAGTGHPSYVLTSRSQKDLETQLRFEKNTPDDLRGGHPEPSWVDWLMGFPIGWTKSGWTPSGPSRQSHPDSPCAP